MTMQASSSLSSISEDDFEVRRQDFNGSEPRRVVVGQVLPAALRYVPGQERILCSIATPSDVLPTLHFRRDQTSSGLNGVECCFLI